MINFRYHLVSLVGVFLALAIGVIMGTAVIDNAVVDRLESQQRTLDRQVAQVRSDNAELSQELDELGAVTKRLGEEGIARLGGVGVLVVTMRGAEVEGLDELRERVGGAGARLLGTVVLTGRWELDDADGVRALREVVGTEASSLSEVRTAGLNLVASALRWSPLPGELSRQRELLDRLQRAGFVEYEAPQGLPDVLPEPVEGTRIVLVSGPGADVSDRQVALPLARALIGTSPESSPARLLVAIPAVPEESEPADGLVGPLRESDSSSRLLSTVDNLATGAGQVAAILALADLGDGQVGHYGTGSGAQDLLPPAPTTR